MRARTPMRTLLVGILALVAWLSQSMVQAAPPAVVATMPVGDAPHGIAANPSTNRVYVANHSDDTASAIQDPMDWDGDGPSDTWDNCPYVYNPDQLNTDAEPIDNGPDVPGDDVTVPYEDMVGDACDDDDDNDGLPDDQEYDSACPYRLLRDSDEDGSLDGYEADNATDPCNPQSKPPPGSTDDSDGDGLVDGLELRGWGTDPYSLDSDGDACDDDKEVASINNDRQANILDALWVAKAAFGIIPCHAALDLNKGGSCELLDALLAARNSTLLEPHDPCQPREPIWPTVDWEVSTPAAQGMDSTSLEGVGDYCEDHGCRAVVVTRHGRVVWERYWGGWDRHSTDLGWSIAKSVTSALVGIAMAEDHITSIDQSVTDFIEEWEGTDKEQIALRHLLSMTSGLEWTENYYDPESDILLMFLSDDQVSYVLGRPLAREPGTYWYYSSGDTELFSRILLVATGMEANEYAQEKLWDVMGMTAMTWPTDNVGQTITYCCVTTTAREFAKFGYLYLRGGRWENQQVVPEGWVLESTQPSQDLYPLYGYYWWLPDFPDAPPDTFEARGFQTKRIYIIPSLDIVAVRLGDGDNTWDGNAFLKPIVEAVTDGG